MEVPDPDDAPATLGRDAYRIVQEALTNVRKHASGTTALVQLTGAPGSGLHISVSNPQPLRAATTPGLPGAGAGLVGLQERVSLSGGTLVHGPDGAGGFVVEADLRW
jgi:signal transduction histidine kinase